MTKQQKEKAKTLTFLGIIIVLTAICTVMGIQSLTNSKQLEFNLSTNYEAEHLVKIEMSINGVYATIFNSQDPTQLDMTYIKSISDTTLRLNSANSIQSDGSIILRVNSLESTKKLTIKTSCGENNSTYIISPSSSQQITITTGLTPSSPTASLGALIVNIEINEFVAVSQITLSHSSAMAFAGTASGMTGKTPTTLTDIQKKALALTTCTYSDGSTKTGAQALADGDIKVSLNKVGTNFTADTTVTFTSTADDNITANITYEYNPGYLGTYDATYNSSTSNYYSDNHKPFYKTDNEYYKHYIRLGEYPQTKVTSSAGLTSTGTTWTHYYAAGGRYAFATIQLPIYADSAGNKYIQSHITQGEPSHPSQFYSASTVYFKFEPIDWIILSGNRESDKTNLKSDGTALGYSSFSEQNKTLFTNNTSGWEYNPNVGFLINGTKVESLLVLSQYTLMDKQYIQSFTNSSGGIVRYFDSDLYKYMNSKETDTGDMAVDLGITEYLPYIADTNIQQTTNVPDMFSAVYQYDQDQTAKFFLLGANLTITIYGDSKVLDDSFGICDYFGTATTSDEDDTQWITQSITSKGTNDLWMLRSGYYADGTCFLMVDGSGSMYESLGPTLAFCAVRPAFCLAV